MTQSIFVGILSEECTRYWRHAYTIVPSFFLVIIEFSIWTDEQMSSLHISVSSYWCAQHQVYQIEDFFVVTMRDKHVHQWHRRTSFTSQWHWIYATSSLLLIKQHLSERTSVWRHPKRVYVFQIFVFFKWMEWWPPLSVVWLSFLRDSFLSVLFFLRSRCQLHLLCQRSHASFFLLLADCIYYCFCLFSIYTRSARRVSERTLCTRQQAFASAVAANILRDWIWMFYERS